MKILYVLLILVIALCIIILIKITRRLREDGGFWYYLQHENRPRRYRRCPDCEGTGALVLLWDEGRGATKWVPPPVSMRGWTDKDGKGGRMEANGTNSKTCLRCHGLGTVWVMPENRDKHLHIPDEPVLPWKD